MRTGVRWQWDPAAFAQNDRCDVLLVTGPYDRDWYLAVVMVGTTKVSVYAYDTRAQAEADYASGKFTNYLAATTGSGVVFTGAPQSVSLTKKTGAAWDPSPLAVTLVIANSGAANWGAALVYYVANVEALLVERMVDTLTLYCSSHEALGVLGVSTSYLHANPVPFDPHGDPLAIDVLLDPVSTSDQFGNQGFSNTVAVKWALWYRNLNPQTARDTVAALATTLRAIAKTQRTWGGMAIETQVAPITLTTSPQDNAEYVCTCDIPLAVMLPDWQMATDLAYPLGAGGKYAYQVGTTQVALGVGQPGGGGIGKGGLLGADGG